MQGAIKLNSTIEYKILNLEFIKALGIEVYPSIDYWYGIMNNIIFRDAEWTPSFVPNPELYDDNEPIVFGDWRVDYNGPERIPDFVNDLKLVLLVLTQRGHKIDIKINSSSKEALYKVKILDSSVESKKLEESLMISFINSRNIKY